MSLVDPPRCEVRVRGSRETTAIEGVSGRRASPAAATMRVDETPGQAANHTIAEENVLYCGMLRIAAAGAGHYTLHTRFKKRVRCG